MTKFSQTKMDVKTLIHPQGCPDFSSYILQIEDYKPDILVTFTFSSDFVTFLRQQKPHKLYQKTIGLHWGSPCMVANSMGKDMEPMWSGLMHGHPSLPHAKKFDEMFFKETGKHVPEDTTAPYYDSVFILKKAIEMAKSAKPEDIAKKMEGLEYSGYAGKCKINPVSHLAIRSHYYMGYLSPVPDLPYFGAKEIYSIPYDKIMVTDQEAKERYGAAFPYTS
jgi:ABC-type branched-subunit amino acid transport system substrate-binding protein